jgi:hypothetical protein
MVKDDGWTVQEPCAAVAGLHKNRKFEYLLCVAYEEVRTFVRRD